VLLVILNVFVYRAVFKEKILTVSILPMKKGSAILIRTPKGRSILINTGADASIVRLLGETLPEWQRSISAILLTNINSNTVGGLPTVFEHYKVKELFRPNVRSTHSIESTITTVTNAVPKLIQVYLYRGDTLAISKEVALDVLWPPRTPTAQNSKYGALILRISYGVTSFLIEENISPRVEKWRTKLGDTNTRSVIRISSSTAPRTYISNGRLVYKQ